MIGNLKLSQTILLCSFSLYSIASHSSSEAKLSQDNEDTFDSQLATISNQVPGFAGAYFDDHKNFVIIISENSKHSHPQKIMQALLDIKPSTNLPVLNDLQKFTAEYHVVIQKEKYDFSSLYKWRTTISKEILSKPTVSL